jgi:hypothetical protein
MTHACIVCVARARPDESGSVPAPNTYERAFVCEPCREWLAMLPGQIVILWARLGEGDDVRDRREYEVREAFIGPLAAGVAETDRPTVKTGVWRLHDPVAAGLPTTARGTRPYSDRVTGSAAETPAPTNLDVVDLAGRVRTSPLSAHARQWWQDQTGHIAVAMELDLVVRAWADQLTAANGHPTRLPVPTVPRLADWITDRMQWACDHHPGIGDDAYTLTRLRGTLRAVLGDTEPRPEHMGAPCPGCDRTTLYRKPGETSVECEHPDCRRILDADHYERWTGLVAAAVRHDQAQERTAA